MTKHWQADQKDQTQQLEKKKREKLKQFEK